MITIEDSTSKPTITIEAVTVPQPQVEEQQTAAAVVQRQPSVYDFEPDWSGAINAGWVMLFAIILIPRVFNLGSIIGFILGSASFVIAVLTSSILLLTV